VDKASAVMFHSRRISGIRHERAFPRKRVVNFFTRRLRGDVMDVAASAIMGPGFAPLTLARPEPESRLPSGSAALCRDYSPSRQHLRAKKRGSQDLMLIANHGLVTSQANSDIGADHVLRH